MPNLKCDRCGSTEFDKQNGMYVCKYCGNTIPIPDAESSTNDEITAESATPISQGTLGASDVNVNPVSVQMNLNVGGTASSCKSTKSWGVTLLLCIFLGEFGIHRFYAGKIGTGVIWLFTGGCFFIGWMYDLIMIILGKFKDGRGCYIKH